MQIMCIFNLGKNMANFNTQLGERLYNKNSFDYFHIITDPEACFLILQAYIFQRDTKTDFHIHP